MLLAWYATVRHDLMAAPEGGGHGSAASGRVLDDVRSGARVGGPAFQISVSDRPRDRGRGARLRAAAAAASVRPAVPARARIAADSLPGGPAHVLARVQGEHPPDRAARHRSGDRDHARRRCDPQAPHSRHTMVRCVRSRGDRVAPRRSGGDLHSFAAQHSAQRGHRARGREPSERRLGPGDLQVRGGGGAHRRVLAVGGEHSVCRRGGRRRRNRLPDRAAVRLRPPVSRRGPH